jgi:uncharacterized membrane protein YkoI
MKKLLFAICFLFGTAAVVNAQDTTATQDRSQTQYSQDQDDDKDRQAISVADLPSTVRDQLQGQDYTGWTVSNAFRKEKDGQTMYMVELKNGNEMKKVKFDAQGNKLKEKDKKDRDNNR